MARTIRKGGKIGKGYNYVVETGEVTYSNDPNIPVGSNVYKEGIRKDIRRPGQRPTDDNANRIRGILQRLIGTEDPEDLMLEIMDALDVSGFIPDPGKYYTFVYNAKTPGIRYDQHPLIATTNVTMKGFSGFNYHWGKMRNYTWNEVAGQLYEVDPGELADLREIPYAKFLNT